MKLCNELEDYYKQITYNSQMLYRIRLREDSENPYWQQQIRKCYAIIDKMKYKIDKYYTNKYINNRI